MLLLNVYMASQLMKLMPVVLMQLKLGMTMYTFMKFVMKRMNYVGNFISTYIHEIKNAVAHGWMTAWVASAMLMAAYKSPLLI